MITFREITTFFTKTMIALRGKPHFHPSIPTKTRKKPPQIPPSQTNGGISPGLLRLPLSRGVGTSGKRIMVNQSVWRRTLRGLRAATALALFAIMASTAHGQLKTENYSWKNVNITAGGFITGIVFHPAEAGVAYVRTDIGGAYRWDKQAKRWSPITDWVGPRENNLGGCESVAVDPSDPNKVYLALGTYGRGQAAIARSADRGTTFQVTNVPFTMGGNEDGRGMGERLAVDPSDGNILYFGSLATMAPVDQHRFRRDAGGTWTRFR